MVLVEQKSGGGVGKAKERMSLPFDADDEDEFGLSRDVESAFLFAQTGQADFLALGIAVLLDVGFGALEDHATLFFLNLYKLYFSVKSTRYWWYSFR